MHLHTFPFARPPTSSSVCTHILSLSLSLSKDLLSQALYAPTYSPFRKSPISSSLRAPTYFPFSRTSNLKLCMYNETDNLQHRRGRLQSGESNGITGPINFQIMCTRKLDCTFPPADRLTELPVSPGLDLCQIRLWQPISRWVEPESMAKQTWKGLISVGLSLEV